LLEAIITISNLIHAAVMEHKAVNAALALPPIIVGT
jgi:hypothetical protein